MGITSLLVEAPVWVASLRGVLTFLGGLLVIRYGLRLVVWLNLEEGGRKPQ